MKAKVKAKVAKKPAKIVDYQVVVSDPTIDSNTGVSDVLLTLKTQTRAWAGSLAKLAKENGLNCVITVPATVKERVVKIAGIN